MPKDEFVDEDPMELVGLVVPGEAGQLELMAECLVEEYARMGWDEKRLMALFANPMFLATHRIYRQKGKEYAEDLVHRVVKKWSVARSFEPGAE